MTVMVVVAAANCWAGRGSPGSPPCLRRCRGRVGRLSLCQVSEVSVLLSLVQYANRWVRQCWVRFTLFMDGLQSCLLLESAAVPVSFSLSLSLTHSLALAALALCPTFSPLQRPGVASPKVSACAPGRRQGREVCQVKVGLLGFKTGH